MVVDQMAIDRTELIKLIKYIKDWWNILIKNKRNDWTKKASAWLLLEGLDNVIKSILLHHTSAISFKPK